MQRCQGCTWSRESGADDGSLLAIAASCFMSSAMAERLASKSLQDQRPGRKCLARKYLRGSRTVLRDFTSNVRNVRPDISRRYFLSELQLNKIRLEVLFGPP